MTEIVLTAIQVDNLANRAFAALSGQMPRRWPIPYKNSVLGKCGSCGGQVWVGPDVAQLRRIRKTAGETHDVHCLQCCIVVFGHPDNVIAQLSNKREGE